MREILFRGQTRRYGEKVRMNGEKVPSNWVYGGCLQGTCDFSIIYGSENENDPGENLEKRVVYTDTLGQFTGLTDKNGKKIFEGDLCLCNRHIAPSVDKQVFTIFFDEEDGAWKGDGWSSCIEANEFSMCEVIGNIHDCGKKCAGCVMNDRGECNWSTVRRGTPCPYFREEVSV